MSNNKQSMKLYTEEQVRKAINDAYWCCSKLEVECVFDKLTPIELPSDEGIKKIMELDDMEFDEFDPYHVSHLDGAKWMRDKIQGGNNEQTTDMMWDEYGNPNPPTGGGDNMNNNPGNTDNTMNMTVLRNHITMYLDDIESYGTRKDLADATDVLFDFVKYINALGVSDDEQAMIDYNAMEEEWEMDNYNEMQ